MNSISRRFILVAGIAFALVRAGFVEAVAIESDLAFEAPDSDLTFLVIGDWGRGSVSQRQLALTMAKIAATAHARFVISTGDNFYPSGVESVDDPQWVTIFESVYDAPSLEIPWYVVLGNHDWRGNISAEVGYTKLSPRWQLPSTYYKHTENLANGSAADFFYLDTTSIAEQPATDLQLAWLKRELAASTALWKIVVGHHPLYSGGVPHGGSKELQTVLEPVFERFGVQVYLNGHNHDLEDVVVGRTHYLTSGAASKAKQVEAIDGTEFAAGRLGFLMVRLTPAEMHIDFIDVSGAVLYSSSIPSVDVEGDNR